MCKGVYLSDRHDKWDGEREVQGALTCDGLVVKGEVCLQAERGLTFDAEGEDRFMWVLNAALLCTGANFRHSTGRALYMSWGNYFGDPSI